MLLCVTNLRKQVLDKASDTLATLIDNPDAVHVPAKAA
jgi:hypothetical protein